MGLVGGSGGASVGGSGGDSVGKGLALSMVVAVLSSVLWVERVECSGNESSRVDKERAIDPDLIRLYLEEFRMELLQMKSQLARMNRNSKLVQTTLKGLHGHRCAPSAHKLTGRYIFLHNNKSYLCIRLILFLFLKEVLIDLLYLPLFLLLHFNFLPDYYKYMLGRTKTNLRLVPSLDTARHSS